MRLNFKLRAFSFKLRALSFKLRALSFKLRAFSFKLRAFGFKLQVACLVVVNHKIVNMCKFTVSAFCTKTRLFNLKQNQGSLLSALLSFVVTIVTVIALNQTKNFRCQCVKSRNCSLVRKDKVGSRSLACPRIQLQWFFGTPLCCWG